MRAVWNDYLVLLSGLMLILTGGINILTKNFKASKAANIILLIIGIVMVIVTLIFHYI